MTAVATTKREYTKDTEIRFEQKSDEHEMPSRLPTLSVNTFSHQTVRHPQLLSGVALASNSCLESSFRGYSMGTSWGLLWVSYGTLESPFREYSMGRSWGILWVSYGTFGGNFGVSYGYPGVS